MGDITLPWPPKELSPNARVHFHSRAAHAKVYRNAAYWLTVKAAAFAPVDGEIMVRMDFHPPDRRKRDLDNMLASSKSAIDGIADALQVNDQRFAFTIRRAEPVKNGRISVSIGGGDA